MSGPNPNKSHPHPKVDIGPLRDELDRLRISLHAATKQAGVDWAGTHRAWRAGRISVWMADRLAVHALNRHPVEIWGDDWLDQHALNDPTVDLRIRALAESWRLRRELWSQT